MAGNVSNIYYGFIRSRTEYNGVWAVGVDKIYAPSRDCRPPFKGLKTPFLIYFSFLLFFGKKVLAMLRYLK